MAFINNIPKYRVATNGSHTTYYSTQCIPLNLPIEYLSNVDGEDNTYIYSLSAPNGIIIGGVNNSPFITGVSPTSDISLTRIRKSTGVSEILPVDTSLLTEAVSINYLEQSMPFTLTESNTSYIVNTGEAENVRVQLEDLLRLFSDFTGTNWSSIYYFLTLNGVYTKITYPVYPVGWPNVISSSSRAWGLYYLVAALHDPPATESPIIYVPIHSTLSGPESAASGETVNVSVSFPDGYIYQENGVSIYNKNGAIPFTYTDGTLSFTMP